MSKHWIQQEKDKKTIYSSSFVCGFTCKDEMKSFNKSSYCTFNKNLHVGVSNPSTEDRQIVVTHSNTFILNAFHYMEGHFFLQDLPY